MFEDLKPKPKPVPNYEMIEKMVNSPTDSKGEIGLLPKPAKKAFEDEEVDRFFWAYVREYPDWYTAFESVNVSLLFAQLAIKEERYKRAMELAKMYVHAKLKKKLYQGATQGFQRESIKTAESLVKMFDEEPLGKEKNKQGDKDKQKDAGNTDMMPYYLLDTPTSDMDNDTEGLE